MEALHESATPQIKLAVEQTIVGERLLVRTVQNLRRLQERCTVRLTIQPEIWPKGAQTLPDEKHVGKGQKENVDEKYECLWLQWPTTLQCEEQRVENPEFPCHISCLSPHQIHQSCLQFDYTLRENHIQRAMKTASVKQGHLNNLQIPSCPYLRRSHYMLSMGVCYAESSSWWMKTFPRYNATRIHLEITQVDISVTLIWTLQ